MNHNKKLDKFSNTSKMKKKINSEYETKLLRFKSAVKTFIEHKSRPRSWQNILLRVGRVTASQLLVSLYYPWSDDNNINMEKRRNLKYFMYDTIMFDRCISLKPLLSNVMIRVSQCFHYKWRETTSRINHVYFYFPISFSKNS